MTKSRNYVGGTEFGMWIREQQELDSILGYRAYDIDYVWSNSSTGEYLFIEEKRLGWSIIKSDPHSIFQKINRNCKKDKKYRGFHLLVFENFSPEDGRIQLNHKDITKADLIKFLQFDKDILYKYTHKEIGVISQKFKPKIVERHEKVESYIIENNSK